MRTGWTSGLWGLVATVATCGAPADGPSAAGGRTVEVRVAALDLEGVGDVVWDVEVVNGRAPAPDVVWQRRLSASRYGDGAGSASYVGPCDAGAGVEQNTVRVWVVGVYAAPVSALGSFAAGAVGDATGEALPFESPTGTGAPLEREVTCAANADVAVQFDVALMRPAQQGFFDVAVSFNDLFCSAKFDCCVEDPETGACAEDLALLFGADGARGATVVLGFACTAGARVGVETELYLDALELDCTSPVGFGAGFAADFVIDPSGPAGNQCLAGEVGGGACAPRVTAPSGLDADAYLFQVGLYRGVEALTSGAAPAQKVYWNVALGVVRAAAGGPGIEDCALRTRGTADDAQGTAVVVDGAIAAGAVYPYVQWEVDLESCGAESLRFGDGAEMVRPAYTVPAGPGLAFGFGFGAQHGPGTYCAAPCEHGTCRGSSCACEAGYSGPTCATNDQDCPGGACGGPTAGTCVDGVGTYSCTCAAGYYGTGTQSCSLCSAVAHCTAVTCAGPGASTCTACAAGYVLHGGACVLPCGLLAAACPAGFSCNTALAAGSSYSAFCVGDGSVPAFGPLWEMVYVPAGTFWMGCNSTAQGGNDGSCAADESPQHLVAQVAYAIDRVEVTAAAYKACVQAGGAGCTLPSESSAASTYGTYGVATKQNHPINYVHEGQAAAYCAWRGKRLCTEAEWERAARGGCETLSATCKTSMRLYAWGSAAPVGCDRVNWGGCAVPTYTSAVGSYPGGTSPYGALDLAGNVYEWLSDWYVSYPGASPGFSWVGSYASVRGGGFGDPATGLRGSRRASGPLGYQMYGHGFRCCRSYP